MRKIIFTILVLFLVSFAEAQVLINLQLPQVGMQMKSQLWSMALINSGNSSISLKVDMVMTDISTGQVCLSGSTSVFILTSGTRQIQITDIVPIQYNVFNTVYNVDASPEGFLPLGTFNICYSVLRNDYETISKIAEECETIIVEPSSPPFLNFPDDQSLTDQTRPLFSWLPPTPINLFNNLSYEFRLVELLNNQNSADAIQSNMPVLMQANISDPFLQYPFSLTELDTAKSYAWQVKAQSNMSAVSNSEIFSFKVKNFQTTSLPLGNVYAKLGTIDNVPLTYCNGVLKYEYVNVHNNAVINLELTDLTSNANKKIMLEENEQEVGYGQNFLTLDLINNSSLSSDHTYLLLVTGAKGEAQAVKFIYKKAD